MQLKLEIIFPDIHSAQFVSNWLNDIKCNHLLIPSLYKIKVENNFDESLLYQFLESCE